MLKIAIRSLLKHKGFSTINVAGLAIGIAACLMIGMYVYDELSYDRFEGSERVFRVIEDRATRNADGSPGFRPLASTSNEIGPLIESSYPSVEHMSRLYPQTALLASSPDRKFQETNMLFADSAFFEVFPQVFLQGTPASALTAPFSMVLSQSAAARYFGSTDPIGKTLTYDGNRTFEITGVVADPPVRSHFGFDILASYSSLPVFMPWTQRDWHWPPVYTYVKLAVGARADDLAAQFPALIREHGDEEQVAERVLRLQAVPSIHLKSQREDELAANGNIAYVYLFSAIALLILLTACINFVNLTTALAGERAREVGVRKALGAQRPALIRQFLAEATTQAVLAMVIAAALIELLLPLFNEVSGKAFALDLTDGRFLAIAAGLVLTVGLMAGSYPAFLMSGFRPVLVLKGGGASGGSSKQRLRSGLVVFQFTVSAAMIACTALIYSQLQFIRESSTGFDEEHTLVLEMHDVPDRLQYQRLKERLLAHPGVINVTGSSSIPPARGFSFNYPMVPEGHHEDNPVRMRTIAVDADFVETFGLSIANGRDFSRDFATDSASAFLMNETAARKLGWEGNAVGKRLTLSYDAPGGGFLAKPGQVVGVVKDFHFASFHQEIEPILIHLLPQSVFSRFLAVRLRPGQIASTVEVIEKEWQAYAASGYPFNFSFLDQDFDREYRADGRLGTVVAYFSVLAVLIACLGLLGLAAFTAQARTKEIGIRKTMGATVRSIFMLLSRDFLKLVGVGFAIAVPVAFFSMSRWLETFAYRITIGPAVFIATAVALVAITILSVSYQSIKAAMTNPVEALRYE